MEAPELERQLAAILAADVEGYSRLMHADEEATMATLSARRMVIDDLISEHRGRIANTAGDSVLAEFASVLDAVSCAHRDPEGPGAGEPGRGEPPHAAAHRHQCRRRHGQGRRHLRRRRQRRGPAGGAGQGRGDLRIAGRARPSAPSRRDDLRGSGRAAGQKHCPPDPGISPAPRRGCLGPGNPGARRKHRSVRRKPR